MTSNIPQARLGKDGPLVPAMSFGLMMFSGAYGTAPSQEDSSAILDRAVELGATLWDTADMYGASEKIVGEWFKRTGRRKEIFLSTKFGVRKNDPTFGHDSSPEYCKKAIAESLEILQTDYIDLYYLHHPSVEVPIEQTMRALAELQKEGKIRHIGLSNMSGNTLRRAIKIAPVAAVQVDYSVLTLGIEQESTKHLLATCHELGVAVVAYSPLGRGLLTSTFASNGAIGDAKDMRPLALPRFQGDNADKNRKLVQEFQKLADKKGCTTSQLALAWLLKQGVVPNPGTKKIKYLESNWEALKVPLTDKEEKEIRAFAESAQVAGSALPEKYKDMLYVDTVEEN